MARSATTTKKSTARKAKAPAPAPVAEVKRTRKMNFNFPAEGKVKPPRENSKRAKVLEMLERPNGATHEEVMKAVNWDRITAYEGIRLLSKHNGYGLREDDKGRIHAFEAEAPKGRARRKTDA
jgi:hypothetical protein